MATGHHLAQPAVPIPQHYPHYQEEPPTPYAAVGVGAYAPSTETFEIPPAKRQRMTSSPELLRAGQPVAASTPTATAAVPAELPTPTSGKAEKMAVGGVTVRGGGGGSKAAAASTKSRRVRTGCLTCRERHLKCDETPGECLNCRKSNRECKRGVRLNFIDIQVKSPPQVPRTEEWSVRFEDESVAIASEYRGGREKYASFHQEFVTPPSEPELDAAFRQQTARTTDPGVDAIMSDGSKHLSMPYYAGVARPLQLDPGYEDVHLSQIQSRKGSDSSFMALPSGQNVGSSGGSNFSLVSLHDQYSLKDDAGPRTHAYRTSDVSSISSSAIPQGIVPSSSASFRTPSVAGPPDPSDALMTPPSEKANGEREYLSTPEEIYYMQVFVEEVGIWMDSLDKDKHFSRVIPYEALKSPMLLHAFLACGVKHLTLINPDYSEDKALFYYDTATTQLLRNLRNPDRNTVECAATAVVLNVYEIMSEKPNKRMSHIAGARALIRECGWNAKSTGIGAACFWLNIGMELLSCLAFNWQTAWDPDQWGLNLDFLDNMAVDEGNGPVPDAGIGPEPTIGGGTEELWVHRIFYITAKLANFRANIPKFKEPSPHDEQLRRQARSTEWQRLKGLCDAWSNHCPRSMRPLGYVRESSRNSVFPNIWLIKRAAIIGRLFYHTAMVLLHQIHPDQGRNANDYQKWQHHHARQVCGIVAHTKDRGVASVAIRSLAISASVLKDRREQEEVMKVFDRIKSETGWRLGKVQDELLVTWGWEKRPAAAAPPSSASSASSGAMPQLAMTAAPMNTQFAPAQQHIVPSQAPPVATTSVSVPLAAPVPQLARPVNPLLVNADFSLSNHPYSNYYAPPNRTNASNASHGFWAG